MKLRIGIVAAEPSGDVLAADLMDELKSQYSEIEFEGIGGKCMEAKGFKSYAPIESLSIMGLFEVIRYLPKIFQLRQSLIKRWEKNKPHIFIGIDAPDYNIFLERRLKRIGVITIHYVCPSVWAWRKKRIKKLYRSIDLLLNIFPFEEKILNESNIKHLYVGHILASKIPLKVDRQAARIRLNIKKEENVLAILPGSRASEVKRLSRPFIETALVCKNEIPSLHIIVPLANELTISIWKSQLKMYAPDLSVQVVQSDTATAITASNVVLVASGTATLEGVLCKRPMVVGYKLNFLTYFYIKIFHLLKIKHFSLANILSERKSAPEFVQNLCEPHNLAPKVLDFFRNKEKIQKIEEEYFEIHKTLLMDTNKLIANAILDLAKKIKPSPKN